MRDQLAKWRNGLRAVLYLVGGGAALGALAGLVVAVLPATAQESAFDALAWVPGLYRSLELNPEHPEGRGRLVLEAADRVVARFPPPGGDWQAEDAVNVDWPALALVTAAWGGLAGLLLLLLWRARGSRRVLGLSLLLGVALGLAVACSLASFPTHWAPFWLRGIGGLPGLDERVGDVVPLAGAEPSSAYLRSSGGLVAEYPPARPPWSADAEVRVSSRGLAWFAAYACAFMLAVLTWVSAIRVKRERLRWPLFAGALALLCWLVLPFLPYRVSVAWSDLVDGGWQLGGLNLADWLPLMERTRLGFDVGFGMLLVLFLGACLVLLPAGVLVAAGHALVARFGVRRQREEAEAAAAPREPIPVEGLPSEPDWLADYEQRRSGDEPPEEPNPRE